MRHPSRQRRPGRPTTGWRRPPRMNRRDPRGRSWRRPSRWLRSGVGRITLILIALIIAALVAPNVGAATPHRFVGLASAGTPALINGELAPDGVSIEARDPSGDLIVAATLLNGDWALDVDPDRTASVTFFINGFSTGVTLAVAAAQLTPVALALDGIAFLEWGDAPFPYPTLAIQNGARHDRAQGGPRLGVFIDFEPDGQPTPTDGASGDDTTGLDDDDGVDFATSPVRGDALQLTLSAGPVPGFVDAWIDFDGDGRWADPEERILGALPIGGVDAGAITTTVQVPLSAQTGATAARFRISSIGGLAPTGPAPDGEVEDYALTIRLTAPPHTFFGAPPGSAPTVDGLPASNNTLIEALTPGGEIVARALVAAGAWSLDVDPNDATQVRFFVNGLPTAALQPIHSNQLTELLIQLVTNRSVRLDPGFSLIAWSGPPTNAAAAFLSAPDFLRAFTWDSRNEQFLIFDPTLPTSLNSLTLVETGAAYWLLRPTDVSIAIWAQPDVLSHSPRTVNLRAGFNLVSWSGVATAAIVTAVANLPNTNLRLFAWNPDAQRFLFFGLTAPALINTITSLNFGRAFWLVLDSAAPWNQPAGP